MSYRFWTEEEVAILEEMYSRMDIFASDIASRLGRSVKQVYLKAMAMGLKRPWEAKSRAGKIGTQSEAAKAHRFQKGHRLPKASEAKRRESLRKSRQELVDREFLRVALGEPQRTKIKIGQDSPRRVQLRYYLRKLGYIIARGSKVAYYDENTRRAPQIEARRKKGDKNYVYFEFLPL